MARSRIEETGEQGSNGQAMAPRERPRSVEIASKGINTSRDASAFLSSLIGDVMTEAVPTKTATVAVNAMGKLLTVVAMQHKYGNPEDQDKTLILANPEQAKDRRKAELLRELDLLNA